MGLPQTLGVDGQAVTTLPLKCQCGTVTGTIAPTNADPGNRAICYCDDCQAFARYLGTAERVLDEHGGSDIFQVSPAQLQIHSGQEQLACVRLRPKGLLRWFCACCNAPLGNTLASPGIAFIGVLTDLIATDAANLNDTLGPVRVKVHGKFANVDPAKLGAHPTAPLSMLFSVAGKLLARRLRGDHRRNPLFDTAGNPIVAPTVLSDAERAALY